MREAGHRIDGQTGRRIGSQLAVVLALLVAVLVLAVRLEASESDPVRAKPAGVLNIGLSGFPAGTMDPILLGFVTKFYLAQIFDYLVGTDAAGQISKQTGLAHDWQVSADQTRWTFVLRDDAKFQNGDPVGSEDVKFSLTRALGPRSTTGYAGVLRDTIAAIDAPSPREVVITTKKPSPFLLPALSRAVSSEGMVVPKAYVERNGDEYFNLHPVGSGPYKVTEHVAGSHITLAAMDWHWRTGVPRYQSIVLRLVPEETTRTAMLRQGKLDMIDVSADSAGELRDQGFQIHLKQNDALVNCWWVEPWADTPIGKRGVREALNMAINRQEMADTMFSGAARPAYIPLGFSWSFPEIGLEVTPDLRYSFDPAGAKRRLAEAGFPNGFPMTIYTAPLPGFPQSRSLAEAIAGYWGEIGVATKVIPVDYAAFRKAWLDRSAPGALLCYNQANRNAYGAYAALDKFGHFERPTGFMHDPEVARLLTAIGSELDSTARNELMRQVFLRMRAESLDVPLLDTDTPYAAAKSLPTWDPGAVMYDLNLDELVAEPGRHH